MKVSSIVSNGNSFSKVAALSLMITTTPIVSKAGNGNKENNSQIKYISKDYFGNDDTPQKKAKKFNIQIEDIAQKAKKIGVELKYSLPEYPGQFASLAETKKLPKAITTELKQELRAYDDNKNNNLDNIEMKNFFKDALKAVDKFPKGFNLTTNVFAMKCKKTCSVDEVFEQKEIPKEFAQKTSPQKAAKKVQTNRAKDTTCYIFQPRTDEENLFKNKTYSQSEINSVLNILKKYEKISIKNPAKLIKQELEKDQKNKNKNKFRTNVLKPLLNLKPKQTVTFKFNVMGNGTPIRGNLKKDYVYIYTVERKSFNRIKITEGIADTVKTKSLLNKTLSGIFKTAR